jgi:succinate dehydrogenase flavin-adding protein (antitoxin of CptAB toxin-antitoxin module)
MDKAKQWMRRPQQRTTLSPKFRRELAEFFTEDVQRLSQLLDRDLTHWVNEDSPPNDDKSMDVESAATQELQEVH